VAEDVHIDDRADFPRGVGLGYLAGGPEIVFAEVAEEGADIVRDLQCIEAGIAGEEAAIVCGDFEAGIADIDGAEEA
jgi:hypothetical protein